MHELYDISYNEAWARYVAASSVYSEQMYQLMMHLITHNDIYLSIDRPPSKRNKNLSFIMDGIVVMQ